MSKYPGHSGSFGNRQRNSVVDKNSLSYLDANVRKDTHSSLGTDGKDPNDSRARIVDARSNLGASTGSKRKSDAGRGGRPNITPKSEQNTKFANSDQDVAPPASYGAKQKGRRGTTVKINPQQHPFPPKADSPPMQEEGSRSAEAATAQSGADQPLELELEADAPVLAETMTVRFGRDLPGEQRKVSNKVRTTKYTLVSWAPLSLLFQFRRAANVYFLVISILTTMSFSPKTPASMIGTFAMVLFFTMLKEAYEDFQRAKSDTEMNCRSTQVLDPGSGEVRRCRWEELHVGDLVKVEKDEEVPADLLLVSAPKDVVFVSTMNLDGETNLKDRELAVTSVAPADLSQFNGQVVCDQPNASLDVWDGNLSSAQLGRVRACTIKNLMLRGCTLKNIPYAFGIVLYVGAQTKIFMNSKAPPRKISNLMKLMNKMLYTVFAF